MTTLTEIKKTEKRVATKIIKGIRNAGKIKIALKTFYVSLDDNLKKLVVYENAQLSCKEGCAYCCHLKVDSRAHEVFLVADYIESNFCETEISILKTRLNNRADIIAPMTAEDHLRTNVRCGLLQDDNRCSVYDVRPSLCRAYHSISLDKCKKTFESPDDMTINSQNQNIRCVARAAVQGFEEALKKIKLDGTAYEINKALLYALENKEYKKNWLLGNKAFPDDADAR